MQLVDWLCWLPRRIRSRRFRRCNQSADAAQRIAERLESRQLPSAVSFTGTANQSGVLTIDLAEANVTSLSVGSTVVTTASGPVEMLRVVGNNSTLTVRHSQTQTALPNVPVEQVGRIVILGTDSADTINLSGLTSQFGLQEISADSPRTLPNGDALNDLANASYYSVIVFGFGGDDRVTGSAFREFVDAGAGHDIVLTQAGHDGIVGGDGDDILVGSLGDDVIEGGAGTDVILGGYGRDVLSGGDGDDLLIAATVDFGSSLVNDLQNLRNRWTAPAANPEVRRQTISPINTTILGIDDNRDGVIDLDANKRIKEVSATSTRLVVPQSMAEAFNPAGYGSALPSGGNFLARIDNEIVRVVSRVVTPDPDTDVIVVERLSKSSATTHDVKSLLIVQPSASQFPLTATSLLSSPVGTLAAQTLFDDFVANTLTGGAGTDFFVVSDELLSFTDLTGDPRLNADDLVTDIASNEDRHRAVNATPEDWRFAIPSDNAEEPGFGETVEALRGTITRLGGDPGTEVLTSDRIGATPTESYVWGGVVRTGYVTNPSYNVTSDLVHLGSFPAANGGANELGQTKFDFLLQRNANDSSPAVTPITPDFPSRNWRWSQNPVEPNVEYAFVSGVGPNGQFSGVQKYQFLTAAEPANGSGQQSLYEHSQQTLVFTSFDPLQVGGLIFVSKSTLYFNPETGHNYMLLVGNPRHADRPNEFDRSVVNAYIVDLDVAALPNTSENAGQWADPVVASFPLTVASGSAAFPFGGLPSNIDDFYFSPDGRYVMVVYANDNGAGFRLLDVDWQNGTMSPHVMPVTPKPDEDIPELRTEAARQNGFFPFRWHHPVFATGASGKTYVVGQPGKWSKDNLVSPNIQYLAGGNTIGQLLRFDPVENRYAALTNAAAENINASRETLSHVTATNTQNPGYVFVSYYSGNQAFTASSPAHKGAIVAVNIEQPNGPDGTVVLAQHRTQAVGNYIAQPLVNASSDGTRVLFHSTWGEYQEVVSTYEISLGSRVELSASGSAVLRRTGSSSVALFASLSATTPIAGTQRSVSAFDTLIVTATPGQFLELILDYSAGTPIPAGGILEFDGTSASGNELKLANVPSDSTWTWSLTEAGAGQLKGSTAGLIRFRGVESLVGGAGSDHFLMADGATWSGVLSGGAGDDSLSFRALTTDVTASLADGTVMFNSQGGVFTGAISQFENVFGGSGNDRLTGDDFANRLDGGGGNDVIDAGAGNDSLDGGAGDDTLNGQAGNDVVVAGAGNDNVRGGNGSDFLTGDAGDDSVFGQNDNDTISGGRGNDLLDASDGADLLVETGDVDAVLTSLAMTGGLGTDSLKNFELAQLTGGAGNNRLDASGFAGPVTLIGGAGDDELRDGPGDDSLDGGAGNDTYKLLALGNDVIVEANGAGLDTLDYSMAVGGVTLDATRTAQQAVRVGHQVTLGFALEQFRGSAFADTVNLSVNASLFTHLDGGGSETGDGDMLRVTSGATTWTLTSATGGTLSGGRAAPSVSFAGFESLVGSADNDVFVVATNVVLGAAIDGGAGTDAIDWSSSAAGRNVTLVGTDDAGFSGTESSLNGGFRHIESLTGSDRDDTLTGFDADAVWDLTAGQLTEVSTGRRLSWDSFNVFRGGSGRDSFVNVRSSTPLLLDGGAGDDLLDAWLAARDVTLLGGSGNDELRGGAGADRLEGGDGDDTLVGGNGNDTLLGQAGNDVLEDVAGNNTFAGGDGADALRVFGTFSLVNTALLNNLGDMEILIGGGEADLLVGTNLPEAFTISAEGITVAGRNVTFAGFETVQGGSGAGDSITGSDAADVFTVSASGKVTAYGASLLGFEFLSGGGGTDRLQGSDTGNESFMIGPTGVNVLGNFGLFTEFEVLAGGDGNDTIVSLWAAGSSLLWSLTGDKSGIVAGYAFEEIETLKGGAGDDAFAFLVGAFVNRIEGGIGGRDCLDYSNFATAVAVNLGQSKADNVGFVTQMEGVRGGRGDDWLVGNGVGEWLDGGDGNDTLEGQGGDDTLTGGLGFDVLNGGTGLADVVLEIRDADLSLTNVSLVVNGQAEDSLSGIERAVLTGGDSANAILTSGFSGAVTLSGGDGDDTLGTARVNDVVDGGLGQDMFVVRGTWTLTATGLPASVKSVESILGGGTSDILVGTPAADSFVVDADGTITVPTSNLTFLGFETLTGGAGKSLDTVTGTSGDDAFEITANGSVKLKKVALNGVILDGFECVSGGSGFDTLIGSDILAEAFGIGPKGITVSSASTTVFVDFELLDGGDSAKPDTFTAAGTADLFELPELGVVRVGGLTLRGFEVISGGAGNDRLAGRDGVAETFVVSSSGVGVEGWDDVTFTSIEQLFGGDGDVQDVITGGAGNETFYADPSGTVRVNGMTLTGFEVAAGGDGNDRLQGSNTLADVFQATEFGVTVAGVAGVVFRGFETLLGGGGNDSLVVFDGAVLNAVFDGGGGLDVVEFGSSTVNRSVTLTASAATGFAGRETTAAVGFVGVVSVNGGQGTDTLIGMNVLATWDIATKQYKDMSQRTARILKWDAFENFVGGSNKDTFTRVTLSATYDGGAGDDLLDASAALVPVTLLGGDGNDALRGGRGNDLLIGGNGRDLLDGDSGDDMLFGGADNDTLRGAAGDDRLSGGRGQDVLQGQEGHDTLVGGSDADSLDGGAGNDVFAPRTGTNILDADTLSANDAEDLLVLTAYVLESEYDFAGATLRPFEWLGSDWEG